jgi:hypothetical protein
MLFPYFPRAFHQKWHALSFLSKRDKRDSKSKQSCTTSSAYYVPRNLLYNIRGIKTEIRKINPFQPENPQKRTPIRQKNKFVQHFSWEVVILGSQFKKKLSINFFGGETPDGKKRNLRFPQKYLVSPQWSILWKSNFVQRSSWETWRCQSVYLLPD